MNLFHLKILSHILKYKEARGKNPTSQELIGQKIDGTEITQSHLEYLRKRKQITRSHGSINLRLNGIDKAQDYQTIQELQRNQKTNERLIEQEKKSSVVETLFTITLVGFSFIQIAVLLLRGEPTLQGLIIGLIAGLAMISVTYIAMQINKENLEDVIAQTDWSLPFIEKKND